MDKKSFVSLFSSALKAGGFSDESCQKWALALNDELTRFESTSEKPLSLTPADVENLFAKVKSSPRTAFESFLNEKRPVQPSIQDIKFENGLANASMPKVNTDADSSMQFNFFGDESNNDSEKVSEEPQVAPVQAPEIKETTESADKNQKKSKKGKGSKKNPIDETIDDSEFPLDDNFEDYGQDDYYQDDTQEYAPDDLYEEKVKREPVKGSFLFWLLFILTAPITLSLCGVYWVFIGGLFMVVALVIAALFLSMVAVIAIGTALSIVGIIYGIIQLGKKFPIGLFEIGLGIALAGITLLLSILVYNLAVRLVPKLFSYISRFAKFVWNKILDLYYAVKKEVSDK